MRQLPPAPRSFAQFCIAALQRSGDPRQVAILDLPADTHFFAGFSLAHGLPFEGRTTTSVISAAVS